MMPVPLASHQIDAAVVLARAFQQGAGTIYLFPDPTFLPLCVRYHRTIMGGALSAPVTTLIILRA
jgi:hypothetical protein